MVDIKLTLLTIKQKREKLQFLRMFAIQEEKNTSLWSVIKMITIT